MSLKERLKSMLGFRKAGEEKPSGSRDPISRDVAVALQRNERAGEAARAALEEVKMSNTLRQIAGRM